MSQSVSQIIECRAAASQLKKSAPEVEAYVAMFTSFTDGGLFVGMAGGVVDRPNFCQC